MPAHNPTTALRERMVTLLVGVGLAVGLMVVSTGTANADGNGSQPQPPPAKPKSAPEPKPAKQIPQPGFDCGLKQQGQEARLKYFYDPVKKKWVERKCDYR